MNPFMERSEPKPNYVKLTAAIFIGVFAALALFCGVIVFAYIGLNEAHKRSVELRQAAEKEAEQKRQRAFSDQLRNMIDEGAKGHRK